MHAFLHAAASGEQDVRIFTCSLTPGEQDVYILICSRAPGKQDEYIFACSRTPGEQDVYIFLCFSVLEAVCIILHSLPIVLLRTGLACMVHASTP